MKPSNVIKTIAHCYATRTPLMLWGPPGVGKSNMIAQFCEAEGIGLIDMRLSQKGPEDLRGLPAIIDGATSWITPSDLPRVETHGERGILFLDEASSMSKSVEAASYQLILDRRLGDYEIPEGWAVMAAGNRNTHGAVANKMGTAMVSRLTHVDVEVSLDDWTSWAFGAGLDNRLIHFLRFRPELLHDFDAKRGQEPFPCPRTWEMSNKHIGADIEIRHSLIAGTVGGGAAAELEGFLRDMDHLPDIDMLLASPEAATVPGSDQPSARYAVTAAVSMKANESNLDNALKYLRRLPAEFLLLGVTSINASKPQLTGTVPMVEALRDLGESVFDRKS